MSIRLLLASNYAMVREGIRLLLGPAREVKLVGQAECLAEAPEKFRDLKPDVVLLDVPVEGSSGGLRAVSHIVRSAPDARAVVLTSNDDVSYARSMLAVGARGYVVKHSPSSALITAVRMTAAGRNFIDPRVSSVLAIHQPDHKLTLKRPALTQREIFSVISRAVTPIRKLPPTCTLPFARWKPTGPASIANCMFGIALSW